MNEPAIERYRVRLRLAAPVRFHFIHGGVLRGLLSRSLGEHELPEGLIPFAPESGRVRFAAGESYDLGFTLVGEARSRTSDLLRGLARLGRQAADATPPTLGGNFCVETAEPLGAPDWDGETAALAGADLLTFHFLSPLRLSRPDELQVRGATFLNADCFPAAYFLQRLAARLSRLNAAPGERPPMPPDATCTPTHLQWIDLPVPGPPRKARPITLGGVLGTVAAQGIPEDWLPWIARGRHLHLGAAMAYGFGRYRLQETAADFPEAFVPSRSALERAATLEHLEEALDHVLSRSDAAGGDGIEPEEYARGGGRRLSALAADLGAGRYRPPPLTGVVLRKPGGGARALAIPTVGDRVAQRAVAQVLAEPVDALLEDCSYAYRKGFSRAGAARALEAAYAEGYRYVLDADVESFFDAVDHPRLFGKLSALWPQDPVVDLLRTWVEAPVVFDGRRIERRRGLPQGGAVSPLLANLFLDELDEEVLGAGFRLVRYADDFVVLAKNLEEARRARKVVAEALADLGLRLHAEKTSVRSFDQGFSYLGYLFVRSLVIEEKKARDTAPPPPLEADDVPAASWLAEVPFQRLRALVERQSATADRRIAAVPLSDGDPVEHPATRPLYLSSTSARLHLDAGNLVVEDAEAGDNGKRFPLKDLSHITFIGHVRATVPLLLALARQRVPSFFCHRTGELYATLGPHQADWGLWLQQGRRVADAGDRLVFARSVVAAKLHNQATLVVRFRWQRSADVAAELRKLKEDTDAASGLDGLLGLEGKGSAVYFAALVASLPEEWGFTGRRRQPPPDPVNAMLSFGYTLLYNHAATALTVAGLDPRVGLFHTPRGTHQALASDLVEEMRWLVDALVWSLVRRGRVSLADFAPSPDGRYPCWMSADFRRRFIAAFESRLHATFTPPGEDESTTYRAFLAGQAGRLRQWVRGERDAYPAFCLHA